MKRKILNKRGWRIDRSQFSILHAADLLIYTLLSFTRFIKSHRDFIIA